MAGSEENIPGTSTPADSIPGGNIPGTRSGATTAPVPLTTGTLTPDAVRALADFADLPLAAGREEAVAAVLGAWLTDIDALNRKMSSPALRDLAPVTTFIHPSADDAEI
jgi:hypothetical protein